MAGHEVNCDLTPLQEFSITVTGASGWRKVQLLMQNTVDEPIESCESASESGPLQLRA